ncbi:MAG TPA: rod shape-determining protein MreC [Chromatiales bacterium]|nr:rod shape-determining protein MreC [Thiotrichales bacterium]HIP68563.1 rod shape-determining protein MreC [Chromatiales bacterium]
MKKPLFLLGPNTNLKFLFFAVFSVVLMLLNQYAPWMKTVRSGLSTLVHPIQVLVDSPVRGTSWAAENLKTRRQLLEDNRKIHEQNRRLHTRLLQQQALEAENERLRELLHSSRRLPQSFIAARLLAVDMNPFRQEVAIDKGSRDGITVGMAFVDANGVMGQVIRVHPFHSDGMLISDPAHALPIQVLRNGLRSIAVGTGRTDGLSLLYLPVNADIQEGDTLVTSGLGRRFPPDYPVAIVETVERKPGAPFATIKAYPLAALDRSREILLVSYSTDNTDSNATEPSPDIEPRESQPNP